MYFIFKVRTQYVRPDGGAHTTVEQVASAGEKSFAQAIAKKLRRRLRHDERITVTHGESERCRKLSYDGLFRTRRKLRHDGRAML